MSKSPKKSKSLTRAGNRPATISAQQTIPYVRMLPDGICQLPGGVYTKTLEYEDINYSVASAEDQTAIFGGWSSWLNYFDSSLPFQLSFVNRRSRSGSPNHQTSHQGPPCDRLGEKVCETGQVGIHEI